MSINKFVLKFFIFCLVLIPIDSIVYTATQQTTNITAYVHPDLDGDGMPNWWELQYGFDPTDPADADYDPDSDLLINLLEYQYGTDPFLKDTDSGGMSDYDEVMVNKDPLDTKDDDDPIKFGTPPAPQFDRRGDSDGDGISNVEEEAYGTDKNKIDTDDDGINDFDELFKYHTLPVDQDTDKDGLKDGLEINSYLTNPKLRDTDFDGLSDYDEIFTYRTNPTKWDTDDGGMSDSDEITNESNPLFTNDDFQFSWTIFLGNEPNDLFKTLSTNKIDIYEGMALNLQAVKTSQVKTIRIKFNEKEFTTNSDYINVKLIPPEKVGVYTLEMYLDLNTNKTIRMTKIVEIKQKGQIIKRLNSKFPNIYQQFNYFKNGPLADAKISIYEYNEISNNLQLYESKEFGYANPFYSDKVGKYAVALKPGNYLIKISKEGMPEKEILYNASKYSIYSDDIYLDYNYDVIVWGGLFTLIFILVYEIINIITYIKYLLQKLFGNIIRKRHLY